MHLSTRVLGASVVNAITARASTPLLVIGSDRFRRADLAAVGCYHWIAAAHLSAAIEAIGGVRSARDLFDRIPPEALVLPGVGAVTLAVLGAVFERKSIGGSTPLEAWITKHRAPEAAREFVTFATLKAHERKRETGEGKASRRRADTRQARRDHAPRSRAVVRTRRARGTRTHATR